MDDKTYLKMDYRTVELAPKYYRARKNTPLEDGPIKLGLDLVGNMNFYNKWKYECHFVP